MAQALCTTYVYHFQRGKSGLLSVPSASQTQSASAQNCNWLGRRESQPRAEKRNEFNGSISLRPRGLSVVSQLCGAVKRPGGSGLGKLRA
jgi:hypothetical protein